MLKGERLNRIAPLILLPVVAAVGVLMGALAGEAQQTARQVKIGVLCAGFCPFGGPERSYQPRNDALAGVGLVQGRTLVWDIGGVINSEDQVAIEAQKLVSRNPTLILVWPGNVAAARAAKDATRSIPILLMAVPDVVEHGLVDSLGRPGGNITGISVPMDDLLIKQMQVLKEISTRLKGIVVVQGDLDRSERQTMDRLRKAAASLQLDAGIRVTDLRNVEQALVPRPRAPAVSSLSATCPSSCTVGSEFSRSSASYLWSRPGAHGTGARAAP
jgi:putative ABC transport system substrate-binding protein